MKQLCLALFASLAVAALTAGPTSLDLTEGWFAQPLQVDLKTADKAVCPQPLEDPKKASEKSLDELMDDFDLLGEPAPRASATPTGGRYVGKDGGAVNWMPKPLSLSGLVPLATVRKGREPANAYNDTYACWYKKSVDVPADWKGSLVTLEQEIGGIELVVFVNGKRAGVMLAPQGFVDVSSVLEYGQTNEIRLFATNKGLGTGTPGVRYRGRDDMAKARHFFSPMTLAKRGPAILQDVFVDTSVRQASVTFRCQVYSKSAQTAEIALAIAEDKSGTSVKTFKKSFALAAGTNTVAFAEAWTDATTWEPSRPFVYTCTPSITVAGTAGEAPARFLFGFREVWREKGQLMLNGHPQSVRGFWGAGMHDVDSDYANFLKAGFNAVYQTHQHESRYRLPKETMELYARKGLMTFIGAPAITVCRAAATDAGLAEEYARYCEYWARSVRNYPSAVGVSVGVNMMCAAWWTMGANDMGKGSGKGDIVEACRFIKRFHPNCLSFAHGDGNLCDIGCSNFYFNFTPLQERLEWYSSWYDRRDCEDTIPYYPAEYGQPYYGSWFGGGQPSMTEFCAIYDGEGAYREEQPRMLAEMRGFAYSKAANFYGGFAAGEKQGVTYTLYDFSEGGRKLHDRLVREVGRAWRAWGCRIAPMYLDDVSFKPGTNNWELAAHSAYNHDLCVFLGGDPASERAHFADRTHAYWAGSKIAKSIVAVWDGLGTETVDAKWTLYQGKASVANGTKTVVLKQGEVKWEPFEIQLPTKAGRYALVATFKAKNLVATERTDKLPIDVYEKPSPVQSAKAVALLDPRGESASALETLGVKVRKVESLAALAAAPESYLVIGRRALDFLAATNCPPERLGELSVLEQPVQSGKHLLVLAQQGDTWKRLGFEPEDSTPRSFFNSELEGVTDADLSYWGGSPLPLLDTNDWHWGPDWGPSQRWHKGGRGWRWTHTHALSLVTLLVPQRLGFRPLIRGEFDLAYSSLMRTDFGQGSVTVCALDFEGRVGAGKCPAATKVATAMMNAYFADARSPVGRVAVSGPDAKRLADCLGLAVEDYDAGKVGAGLVVIAGNDSTLGLDDLRAAVKKGAKVLVVGNDEIAKEAGFTFTKFFETQIRWAQKKMEYADDHMKDFKRPKNQACDLADDGDDLGLSLDEVKVEKKLPRKPKGIKDCEIPLVWYATTNKVERSFCRSLDQKNWEKFPHRGVGLSLLRWRESPRPSLLTDRAGWTLTADGVFAISDDGGILLDQISPFKVLDERSRGGKDGKGDSVGKANYSLSLDNNLRRHALILMNWGVAPSPAALRCLFDVKSEGTLYWSANRGFDPYGYVYW